MGAATVPRLRHQLSAGGRATRPDGGEPVALGHGRPHRRSRFHGVGLARSVSGERDPRRLSVSTSASASSSRRCSRRSRRAGKVVPGAGHRSASAHNWREVALTTLVRTGQLAPYYIFTTYILTYGTQVLGLSRTMLLNCLSMRSITSILMIPLAGYLSDRFGRKRIVAVGLHRHRPLGVRVFRAAEHRRRGDDLFRDVDRRLDAGPAVRSAGRADLGSVPGVAALHGFGARLSSRRDHRRRSGAGDCHLSLQPIPDAVRDRRVWRSRRR